MMRVRIAKVIAVEPTGYRIEQLHEALDLLETIRAHSRARRSTYGTAMLDQRTQNLRDEIARRP